ncbi:hypothetical protein [Thermovibrio sp.]
MTEFDSFLKRLWRVELSLFAFSLTFLLVFKGISSFTLSFVLGYFVALFDLFLLARFSKRVPQLALSGYFPKSGFTWRFVAVALILFGLSMFTTLNFFAIISAVAAANLGLFVAVILQRKELERWNTEA